MCFMNNQFKARVLLVFLNWLRSTCYARVVSRNMHSTCSVPKYHESSGPPYLQSPSLTIYFRSFDGKVKVWSTDTKACVATYSETDKALYAVKWIPRGFGIGEGFLTTGANRSIRFYREAVGG